MKDRAYRTNYDPRPPFDEACDWDKTVINVRARDARRLAERAHKQETIKL